jgi:hypothetical protein
MKRVPSSIVNSQSWTSRRWDSRSCVERIRSAYAPGKACGSWEMGSGVLRVFLFFFPVVCFGRELSAADSFSFLSLLSLFLLSGSSLLFPSPPPPSFYSSFSLPDAGDDVLACS